MSRVKFTFFTLNSNFNPKMAVSSCFQASRTLFLKCFDLSIALLKNNQVDIVLQLHGIGVGSGGLLGWIR